MPATPSDLAELRRRLDEIDDKLHDLLIERGEIISMVAASKRDGKLAAFQPGREAEIVRRLVDRHRCSDRAADHRRCAIRGAAGGNRVA